MTDVALLAVFGGAWVLAVLGLTLPRRAVRASADVSRRLGELRGAVHALGDEPTVADLERVLALAHALDLRDEDAAEDLARLRTSLEAATLAADLKRGVIPSVPAPGLAPGDVCHFMVAARFGRRRADQFGHVLLTSGWLKFRGVVDATVAWSQVAAVERHDADVIVHLADSRRILRFVCQTTAEAARGGVIARYLARTAVVDAAHSATSSFSNRSPATDWSICAR